MGQREIFRAVIDAAQARDPVACGSCRACCRSNQVVEMRWDWGDDPSLYDQTEVALIGQKIGTILRRTDEGDCVYLGAAGCTIYDRRPMVCRGFDCRRNLLSFTAEQRAEAISRQILPRQVFEAGEARISTIDLDEEEQRIFTSGLGHYVLNNRRTR